MMKKKNYSLVLFGLAITCGTLSWANEVNEARFVLHDSKSRGISSSENGEPLAHVEFHYGIPGEHYVTGEGYYHFCTYVTNALRQEMIQVLKKANEQNSSVALGVISTLMKDEDGNTHIDKIRCIDEVAFDN